MSSKGFTVVRNRWVLAADLAGLSLAALAAFILRLDWFLDEYTPIFLRYLVLALIIKPPIFMAFGLYSRYWRLASTREFLEIFMATCTAAAAMAVAVSVGVGVDYFAGFPRSVLFIDWLLTLGYVGGLRMSIRLVAEARERSGGNTSRRRVLVAGAGQAGALMVREIARNPALALLPVGFLDDDAYKHGKRIHGVPVIGALSDLPRAVERLAVDEVVIAMPKASGAAVRKVIEACEHQKVRFRIIPGVFELLEGSVGVTRLREVEISDLLRREQIRPPAEARSYVTGKTVLVTGAGGSIGSELCRQIIQAHPSRLVMVGHGENSIFDRVNELRRSHPEIPIVPVIADIRNLARMRRVFAEHRPQFVFHAAAHKHVPLMEDNPEEAVSNNVIGTTNIVNLALEFSAERLTFISTDKAVAPANVMGASKRMAEAVVRRAARRHSVPFMVVRFGNVLGSRGSVVPVFKEQIARGGPVTVTHPDVTRFFMTIPEAVHLVLTAAGMGSGGELFVLNMGQPVRIVDLAQDLIRLSGASEEIPIVFSGLRPGEKLDEELWEPGSVIEPTENPDIMRITEPAAGSEENIEAVVSMLTECAARGDAAALTEILLSWTGGRSGGQPAQKAP